MSERHPIALRFISEQLERALHEIRSLRDDVDVLTEIIARQDSSFERLETSIDMLRIEMGEIRSELRAMHRQQRTAARVRAPRRRTIPIELITHVGHALSSEHSQTALAHARHR